MPGRRSRIAHTELESPAVEAIRRVGVECRLIIIRQLMDGPKRFHELQRIGMGIEAKSLSRVLKYLVSEGIAARRVLATQPVAVEYSLTEKGRELRPVIDSLDAWGERWVVRDPGRAEP